MHFMNPDQCHVTITKFVCVCVCVCVGWYMHIAIFIGNMPATERGWVIIKLASDELSEVNDQ